jgi:uncharacterized protein YceH (UPF0502 family)
MNSFMTDDVRNQIRQLSRIQRRVIGVLMEKAFTTPDQYPLTLKATTTGCNQKNNREPVSEYSEDQVADTLEQLRELGVIAEVFTDGGRAARYRHYMRQKFDFTETQFAVIAELLLRGRQQPGELRTRASRMVRIESSEHLRADLMALQEKGFLQSNGPLDRRGVEVDHTFYLPKEGQTMSPAQLPPDSSSTSASEESRAESSGAGDRSGVSAGQAASSPVPSAAALVTRTVVSGVSTSGSGPSSQTGNGGSAESRVIATLTDRLKELSASFEEMKSTVESLQGRIEKIEREFGI